MKKRLEELKFNPCINVHHFEKRKLPISTSFFMETDSSLGVHTGIRLSF